MWAARARHVPRSWQPPVAHTDDVTQNALDQPAGGPLLLDGGDLGVEQP
jgi:hypothetical protein